jgi:hypothetical protein
MDGASIGPIMVGSIVAGLGIQYVFAALAAVLAAPWIPLNHAICSLNSRAFCKTLAV